MDTDCNCRCHHRDIPPCADYNCDDPRLVTSIFCGWHQRERARLLPELDLIHIGNAIELHR